MSKSHAQEYCGARKIPTPDKGKGEIDIPILHPGYSARLLRRLVDLEKGTLGLRDDIVVNWLESFPEFGQVCRIDVDGDVEGDSAVGGRHLEC